MDINKLKNLAVANISVGRVDWQQGVEIALQVGTPPKDGSKMCRYPGDMREEDIAADFAKYVETGESEFYVTDDGVGTYWRKEWELEQRKKRRQA